MSTKCWIIEQGEYSDYRVVGIFTSLAAAEQALAYMKLEKDIWDEPTITERPLNPCIAELNAGLTQYQVIFRPNDCLSCNPVINLDPTDMMWGPAEARFYSFTIWAKDKDHAIKIAAERKAQLDAGIIVP